ncbi:Lrp/AsnC ligand binding domain-containing protein, partial [Streptomyces sp. NPDC050636]|uniref:Lrp/AsnC ligand binding domain-containing protein n=1 Tax=Streptomyces sp. NPDC050636 TaxID=3154510 RepID=UPI00343EC7D0
RRPGRTSRPSRRHRRTHSRPAASAVTGEADAIVQVFASDMRHFERVLERIAGEPFVERTKSVLVLSPLLRRFGSGAPG